MQIPSDSFVPASLRASFAGIDWTDASLHGSNVRESVKTLGQLQGIFRSTLDWEQMDPDTVVYRVQWLPTVADGTEGGLFWGNTVIEAGHVGCEYFMTHGHFHRKPGRGEFYATVQGEGMLLLMHANRKGWVERMLPGTLHYIPGELAHRVVNTGNTPLKFFACWPSDAGHDYASILETGFSISVISRDGNPVIVLPA